MEMQDKIKALKLSVESMSSEEKQIRNRIQELKSLLAEKQKRKESLDAVKKEEAELLKQLGL